MRNLQTKKLTTFHFHTERAIIESTKILYCQSSVLYVLIIIIYLHDYELEINSNCKNYQVHFLPVIKYVAPRSMQ